MSYVLHQCQRVWEKVGDSSHLASEVQHRDDHYHRQSGNERSNVFLGRDERKDGRSPIGI